MGKDLALDTQNRAMATTLLLSTIALLIVLGVCCMMLERAKRQTLALAAIAEDYRQKAEEAEQLAVAKEELIKKLEAELNTNKENARELTSEIQTLQREVGEMRQLANLFMRLAESNTTLEEALKPEEALTAIEYRQIREKYPELELSENMADYNVIVLRDLTDAELRRAMTIAGNTAKDDLIVARTTSNNNTSTANTITLNGTEIPININAEEKGKVILVSLGDEKLTIDADKKSRIFSIAGGSEVKLAGLTMRNGMADDGGAIYSADSSILSITQTVFRDNQASKHGGAIDASWSVATILQSVFVDNEAMEKGGAISCARNMTISKSEFTGNIAQQGGAIYSIRDTATVMVRESEFTGNQAREGGAIYAAWDSPTTVVSDSKFTGNKADVIGGAVFVGGLSTTTISKSEFTGNTAVDGGVIRADRSARVMISDTKFTGNEAGRGGGAIDVTDESKGTVLHCEFTDNSAGYHGGAICASESSSVTVTQSVFIGNKADYNGGVIVVAGSPASVLVSQSEFLDNSAGDGGGIYTHLGTLAITNSTITGNKADRCGGGISIFGGTTTLYNTIVVENSIDIFRGYGTIQGHNNLMSPFDWDGDSGNNFVYNPNLPLFVDAANGDYRLARNSQAIDRGNNQYALDAGMTDDSRDLADNPRFNGTNIDIGAYEF